MNSKWMTLIKVGVGLGLAGAGLFVAIQFAPRGVSYTNPPVVAEPAWDSPATRALAVRACFDCHSHETRWPVYARIAPVSWLVAHDVVEGRAELNFSDWGTAGSGGDDHEAGAALEELVEVIREGEMPPASYVLLHPDARLTPSEQQQLIEGLQQSLP